MVVKYCDVPCCDNTSLKTSRKIFIRIPRPKEVRDKWYNAMNQSRILTSSYAHVCEDHFDLENDAENWMEYKLMGCPLKIKKNVVPHLNLAINEADATISQISSSAKKRKEVNRSAISSRRKLFQEEQPSTSGFMPVHCSNEEIVRSPSGKFSIHAVNEDDFIKLTNEVGVQTSIETSTIGTQINFWRKPQKIDTKSVAGSDSSSSSPPTNSDSSFIPTPTSSTDTSPTKKYVNRNVEQNSIISIQNIENNSRLYLGIPEQEYFLLKLLTSELQINYKNILITLKKIRLNDSYKRISIEFGVSSSTISRILFATLPKLTYFFQDFIYWPDSHIVQLKQPIQFSVRYREVQSVIDCLEIEIQTPTNPYIQAQTWSSYKKCNTIKYLISATPHGFINFISEGYGGRTTDADIVEKSGYLNKLPENCSVMADRGFKNVSNLLHRHKCVLVRPPSVSADTKMSKEEVTESKRIAALRIHIERVIRRLREFNILSPHACVHSKLIPWLNNIIIITCGIVNIQGELIK